MVLCPQGCFVAIQFRQWCYVPKFVYVAVRLAWNMNYYFLKINIPMNKQHEASKMYYVKQTFTC